MSTRKLNTDTLLKLASADEGCVLSSFDVDPEGMHLIYPVISAMNDQPVHRCEVLIKQPGTDRPIKVLLDISFADYERLERVE